MDKTLIIVLNRHIINIKLIVNKDIMIIIQIIFYKNILIMYNKLNRKIHLI